MIIREQYLLLVSRLLGREIKTVSNKHLLWLVSLFIGFLIAAFVVPQHNRTLLIYALAFDLAATIVAGVILELYRKPHP
jgi:hypothetical protein